MVLRPIELYVHLHGAPIWAGLGTFSWVYPVLQLVLISLFGKNYTNEIVNKYILINNIIGLMNMWVVGSAIIAYLFRDTIIAPLFRFFKKNNKFLSILLVLNDIYSIAIFAYQCKTDKCYHNSTYKDKYNSMDILYIFTLIQSHIAFAKKIILIVYYFIFYRKNTSNINIIENNINDINNIDNIDNIDHIIPIPLDNDKDNIDKYQINYGTIINIKKNDIIYVCSICNIDYDFNDDITILNCSHYYHKKCINKWFELHYNCVNCYIY